MRIFPVINSNSFVNKAKYTQSKLENNNFSNPQNLRCAHQYTGIACADLAYASMFDSAIAKDLKLMGLI